MSPPQGGLIIYAMRIVHFPPHSPAHVVQRLDELPPAGLVWIDCLRNEAADWGATLEPGCRNRLTPAMSSTASIRCTAVFLTAPMTTTC